MMVGGWARFRSVALAVAWRNLHNYFTNPALILPGLLFPLFFFTAFAGGLSAVGDVRGFDYAGDYTSFQFVFVLFQSAAFAGVFNAFSIARDFETGFARRLFLAAPNRIAVVAGYGLASLGRWLFTASVLTAVAFAVQMDVGGSGIDLFGLYLLAALINMASTLFAAGVALRTRTIQAGPAMQIPVFIVLFFAPVYVPLALLADWIHAIATVNPITYVLEAGRGLISGDLAYIGLAFGLTFALIAGFAIWALRGLRKAEAAG
jgi:ABC-type multidrug transport system permease subunit